MWSGRKLYPSPCAAPSPVSLRIATSTSPLSCRNLPSGMYALLPCRRTSRHEKTVRGYCLFLTLFRSVHRLYGDSVFFFCVFACRSWRKKWCEKTCQILPLGPLRGNLLSRAVRLDANTSEKLHSWTIRVHVSCTVLPEAESTTAELEPSTGTTSACLAWVRGDATVGRAHHSRDIVEAFRKCVDTL